MKLSGDFIIRNIADEYVIVPVGETAAKFHSLITANELGAFICTKLKEDKSEDEILKAILEDYDIDEDSARRDLSGFLQYLKNLNLLETD